MSARRSAEDVGRVRKTRFRRNLRIQLSRAESRQRPAKLGSAPGDSNLRPAAYKIAAIALALRDLMSLQRTQNGHIRPAFADQAWSSPPCSKSLICSGFLSARDPACPPLPSSGIMKEILGKQLGT
jgi:hypothetical protein